MGIKIINGFDLNSPLPLDSRAVVENATEMNELITKNFVSIGQTCFNKADNKLYVLKANNETLEWSEVGGSIAATALTNEDLDTLKTEGSYYAGGSNTCTNKPTGIDAFGLTIKRVASGYYTQYLTGGNTNTGQVYTRTFTSGAWTSWIKFTQDTQLATKQDKLVSGTNIKTINGNSLLGSGDLTIESESVSPTLFLFNPTTSKNRTTITEQEKINLEKGLYNQIVYNGEYNNQWLFPTKLFYFGGDIGFTSFSDDMTDETDILKELIFNFLEIGKKDSDGNYPITITLASKTSVPGYIPTLSTIVSSLSVLPTTIYSVDDINLIKQQKNNFIKLPIGNTNNYTCELCYVYYDNINYILVDIAGEQLILSNGLSNSPNFLFFKLDETNKKLVGTFFSSLSSEDVKTISLFGNHSILVPKDSTDTNIDLYNHAIKISGSITSGETTTNLKVYTTITSSNNLEIDSITDLNTILGSSYEVMCSGFYGANSVISISKTAEGNPSFGYNNNGGESLISFSKFTNLVIKDTVKTV